MKFFPLGLIFLTAMLPVVSGHGQRVVTKHPSYGNGVIMPDILSQKAMEDSLVSFYKAWKNKYLKQDNCTVNGLYVLYDEKGENKKCVSEGQGFGMVIVAYMADWDPSAREIFDSLYFYYKQNRVRNPHDPDPKYAYLMSGYQTADCNVRGRDAATDGDLDIAYALLVANAQWHSHGTVNYLREAENLVHAILKKEINDQTLTVLKGNAVEKPDVNAPKDKGSPDYFDMRPSDFMPAHFKTFARTFHMDTWDKITDSCYRLFETLQRLSKGTGLVPDFVQHVRHPRPAKPKYEETADDGKYAHNACRVPWRIATDYILNGDERSKRFADTINKWIVRQTHGKIDHMSEGYRLDGSPIGEGTSDFPVMSFVCPFAVSAMVDSRNQEWLNTLYRYIIDFRLDAIPGQKDEGRHDYYNNTIKMFTMIILTGKYWAPVGATL